MRSVDAEALLAAVAAGRHGVVSTAVCPEEVGDRELAELRRRGVLVSLGRGVDRMRDHPFTWRSQCRALLDIAGAGSVLGLRSGGRLHGCWRYRNALEVEVLIRRGADHRTSLGRIVQTGRLPDKQITVVDGFPVTTLARTFFDLCGDPDPGLPYRHPAHERAMRRVYNDALARRGLTFMQEATVVAVTARRGRRGSTLARRILLSCGKDHRPTTTDLEALFLELVDEYGLPRPTPQVPLSDVDGWIGTVDFCWPDHRLVVEVDSPWHDGPDEKAADEERDRRLEAAGYTVHRYRYDDLIARPGAIARQLGAATSAIRP